ncbi:hypothetical protein L523_2437 [Bordetella bronchiseptica MBORD731]|nr:hypothetical protein L523_2437 [Bordetella bronchiseptica MBORD731]
MAHHRRFLAGGRYEWRGAGGFKSGMGGGVGVAQPYRRERRKSTAGLSPASFHPPSG